jgi:signal transduction histidine kinase
LSFTEKQLKLKTDELISKTIKINEANRALAVANQKLESKTTELNNNNKSLFESNREIAEIYKELAETNKAFAKLNQESTTLNKELALAYQKIEQQNQTYEAFINIAAHELRTPAQSILGYAEIAKNDPAYKEDKEGYLHVIFRNAFRLDKLIKNILDVTKIEGNTLHLDKQRFNLNDILLSVLEDTKTQILANDSKLKLSLSLDKSSSTSSVAEKHDDLISVEADRERITQVLYNLLDNAIKFSKEGTISVRIERKRKNEDAKDVIVIGIKDTGSGIDSEIMPKLFSKFASKSFSGTGLGLYISKSIVEAHGGKIWAENNTDGKGASFSFSLPLD